MELPSMGKQCAQSSCKQLDFLPLQCKCGQIFCSEHFNFHVQNCEKSKFLTEEELKTIQNTYTCCHSKCNDRSIVPLICERCKKHFCIKHRHLVQCEEKSADVLEKEMERYIEPVRQFNEAKAIVDKQVENNLKEARKKSKSREIANKVQLMKLKNKAVGLKSIPAENRVYFSVTYISSHINKSIAIFVSNQWTVGRAIDVIAQEHKLQNNNNKSNEKKLRLFKKEDGEVISTNVSVHLSELLKEKVIVDGDDLLIQYVEDDCEKL